MVTVVNTTISVEIVAFVQFSNFSKIGAPATGEYTSIVMVVPDAKSIGEAKHIGDPTVTPAQQSAPGNFVVHNTAFVGSVGSTPIVALILLPNGVKVAG